MTNQTIVTDDPDMQPVDAICAMNTVISKLQEASNDSASNSVSISDVDINTILYLASCEYMRNNTPNVYTTLINEPFFIDKRYGPLLKGTLDTLTQIPLKEPHEHRLIPDPIDHKVHVYSCGDRDGLDLIMRMYKSMNDGVWYRHLVEDKASAIHEAIEQSHNVLDEDDICRNDMDVTSRLFTLLSNDMPRMKPYQENEPHTRLQSMASDTLDERPEFRVDQSTAEAYESGFIDALDAMPDKRAITEIGRIASMSDDDVMRVAMAFLTYLKQEEDG